MSDAKRTPEPHDRLTRICDAMIETLEAHEENSDDVRCVIFLQDAERGGIVLHGYDQDTDAIVDLFIHLKAIFEANGKTLMLVPVGEG